MPHLLLNAHGAVSEEVARAMAEGALHKSNADVAISITGIAGPGGATGGYKPVGLVYFGCAREHMRTMTIERRFGAIGRDGIREEIGQRRAWTCYARRRAEIGRRCAPA